MFQKYLGILTNLKVEDIKEKNYISKTHLKITYTKTSLNI